MSNSETPAVPNAEPEQKKRRKKQPRNPPVRRLPPYNVVLLNDDDHSYEYVIDMLKELFAYGEEKGFQLAEEVDSKGRVIVLTTHKEHAELKRDQIHAYGRDVTIAACQGSMSAVIEPAEG